jgi:hypothetical protein
MRATRSQLLYEWAHLKAKLRLRDARRHSDLQTVAEPGPHPLFEIAEGDIEDWEVVEAKR